MKQFTGTVQYAPFAQGSKSEGERPFLVAEDGSRILLYKKNDNPFENKGLSAYAGKRVLLQGEVVNGAIEVEAVEEAPATSAACPAADGTTAATASTPAPDSVAKEEN